ncbi:MULTISPECIES: pentapeptide repeat-containing protein [unclassified Arthrobacter]|uniref:pentapeptide repeat-containing protein n=1 Tax=unclassified Arthrobacter TaxID=235627 RepID=UPI0028831A61|nr:MULTISPECIES: pentapeptide repeat-containing protein [unclassified Arthrobacter]
MRRLWSRLQSTSLPSLILIAVIFAVGITMWALGPSEGNKYSDLGINLGVGAVLGVAVLYVEAVVGRAEAERERRLAEEQRFVQTLIAAADLTEIRIPGRSLTGIILAARDLSGGDLSSTDLTRADLRKSNLSRADLSDSAAVGLNLHGATVDALRARNVDWTGANLSRLSGSDADFTAARIIDSCFADVRLPRAVLDNAVLERADMRRADLSDCRGTAVVLRGTDMRAASLRGGQLVNADLRDADLRAADLRNASFECPDLRGADLRDCNVEGLMLREPIVDDRTRLPVSAPHLT